MGRVARWCICASMTSPMAIRVVLMRFCTTMNTRLRRILLWKRNEPFTTSMGLKRATITAGIKPATNDTTRSRAMAARTEKKSAKRSISESSNISNHGRIITASMQPNTKHPAVNTSDSSRLRPTASAMLSPKRRRVAISLARLPIRAVVRLT